MAQRFERTYFRCREALLKLQRERGIQQAAEPVPPVVRDEPTSPPASPPAPPEPAPRATGWRRWFAILAIFVPFLLLVTPRPGLAPPLNR
jgi:hypothetical protein